MMQLKTQLLEDSNIKLIKKVKEFEAENSQRVNAPQIVAKVKCGEMLGPIDEPLRRRVFRWKGLLFW